MRLSGRTNRRRLYRAERIPLEEKPREPLRVRRLKRELKNAGTETRSLYPYEAWGSLGGLDISRLNVLRSQSSASAIRPRL